MQTYHLIFKVHCICCAGSIRSPAWMCNGICSEKRTEFSDIRMAKPALLTDTHSRTFKQALNGVKQAFKIIWDKSIVKSQSGVQSVSVRFLKSYLTHTGGKLMNLVEKENIHALAEALRSVQNNENEVGDTETVADFINTLLAEPDKKRRKQMIKEFSERRKDAAKFLEEHEELINAEAELALIGAAVGRVQAEKEISYKGGKRRISAKIKKIPPNVAALNFLLKNRMPDKYSDKPQTEIEIEDVSDTEEDIYGENNE